MFSQIIIFAVAWCSERVLIQEIVYQIEEANKYFANILYCESNPNKYPFIHSALIRGQWEWDGQKYGTKNIKRSKLYSLETAVKCFVKIKC